MGCLQTLAIYSQLKATRNGKHLLSQLKMCLLNCVCWGGKAQLLLCRRTFNIMVCFAIFYTFTVTYQAEPCNQLSQTSSNNLLTTWRIHIFLLQVAATKALVLTFPCVVTYPWTFSLYLIPIPWMSVLVSVFPPVWLLAPVSLHSRVPSLSCVNVYAQSCLSSCLLPSICVVFFFNSLISNQMLALLIGYHLHFLHLDLVFTNLWHFLLTNMTYNITTHQTPW